MNSTISGNLAKGGAGGRGGDGAFDQGASQPGAGGQNVEAGVGGKGGAGGAAFGGGNENAAGASLTLSGTVIGSNVAMAGRGGQGGRGGNAKGGAGGAVTSSVATIGGLGEGGSGGSGGAGGAAEGGGLFNGGAALCRDPRTRSHGTSRTVGQAVKAERAAAAKGARVAAASPQPPATGSRRVWVGLAV